MARGDRIPGSRPRREPGAARGPRGKILAVKWGMNPNSSSLGVDVTFLLAGATAVSLLTPLIGALLRWRKPAIAAVPPRDPDE